MVSLTHLPHLDFLALMRCTKLRFLSLPQQCHTRSFKDWIGNIPAVSVRNLLKFHILHNAANINHLLTSKHDLCTVHAHLELMCTGNFSAVPERNFLKLQTTNNVNHLQASKHDLCTVCAHLKLTRTGNISAFAELKKNEITQILDSA